MNNDWLNLSIFEIFSGLLTEYGSKKRFFFSDIGQSVLVVLIEKDNYMNLSNLLNIFIPAKLE
ncbi:hypothetical protein D3C87_2027550 [compost metagenome]